MNAKSLLIIDEPEVHLHPEWQVKFAEILTLLQKEIDIHILLTTHSPYFLQAIDVFSRKAMIYGVNNKKSENLIKNILEFCANNSFPKEFCSDNGPEFKNSKLNEICEKEGITYIHGIPYNHHSQGTVERFHYTIKKYLGKEYINNGI